jgi:hypothetical protein
MATACARLPSAQDAAYALELAEVSVSSRHLQRIAHEIGDELIRQRDHKAQQYRRRELPVRVPATPEVVAVEVDGGRLRTRQAGQSPGVFNKENNEDKIACLVSLQSQTHSCDPQPEPPEKFQQPRRVQRLVQQMKGHAGEALQEQDTQADRTPEQPPRAEDERQPGAPTKRVRTAVASMANSQSFGPLVAAEAQERGFFLAQRRAFVADGAAYNWTIQQGWFLGFEPITDFLHVLCYLYLAGWAVGGDEETRWSTYLGWMKKCWCGRTQEVIEELGVWQERLGEPPEGEELDEKDPRGLVGDALRYLSNNQTRMDYPRYRQAGLPITSSLAESLVGQFNARVKSKQKYWRRDEGAESILQLRAAVLSEDGRLERHFAQRPGNPYRRRYND